MRTIFRSMVWVSALALAACGGDGDDGSGPPQAQTGGARGLVLVGTTGVASVPVSAEKSGETTKTANTNANGQFTFTGLDVGSWTISITAPEGYALAEDETGSRSVTVTADQVAEVGSLMLEESGGNGETADVGIPGRNFDPQTVTVSVGTTVRWTNTSDESHNVTGSGFGTGTIGPTQNKTVTFNTAGTFPYECTFHSGMTGTVVVQQ